jgi:transposase InsO family protein
VRFFGFMTAPEFAGFLKKTYQILQLKATKYPGKPFRFRRLGIIQDGLMRSGNGAEFIAEKVRAWIAAVGAKTAFIEPGSPWENGSCESFNARFRDEFLNGEVFSSLCEAQIRIEKWRRHDNTVRPHSALGYRPSTGNHRPNGPEAHHAPTFKPDCSMGAVHL